MVGAAAVMMTAQGAPMNASDPLGVVLREHFRTILTKAPRERPGLLFVVVFLGILVLAAYAIAYIVGA